MQYPNYYYGQKLAVSYGIIKDKFMDKEYNFIHYCCTEKGSSGSPILNITNNKIIGIHKSAEERKEYNVGAFLYYSIKEFINKYNNNKNYNNNYNYNNNNNYNNYNNNNYNYNNNNYNNINSIEINNNSYISVLIIRKRLQSNLILLKKALNNGLNQVKEIKDYIKMISKLKENLIISNNLNMSIEKIILQTKNVALTEKGIFMTNCLICNKTCHHYCSIENDDDKSQCICFINNFCTICSKNCHWKDHKNMPYEIVLNIDKKILSMQDINDLKKRYNNSNQNLDAKSLLLLDAESYLRKFYIECFQILQEMLYCLNELSKIALSKKRHDLDKLLDNLISSELEEHSYGWENIVQGLRDLKNQKKNFIELQQMEKNNCLVF